MQGKTFQKRADDKWPPIRRSRPAAGQQVPRGPNRGCGALDLQQVKYHARVRAVKHAGAVPLQRRCELCDGCTISRSVEARTARFNRQRRCNRQGAGPKFCVLSRGLVKIPRQPVTVSLVPGTSWLRHVAQQCRLHWCGAGECASGPPSGRSSGPRTFCWDADTSLDMHGCLLLPLGCAPIAQSLSSCPLCPRQERPMWSHERAPALHRNQRARSGYIAVGRIV